MKLFYIPFFASVISMLAIPAYAADQPFVGRPKTRNQLLKCEEVVSTYSKKIYAKGNKVILTMSPKWAMCRLAKKPTAQAPVLKGPPASQADIEAKTRLDLEARNMALYGNPLGSVRSGFNSIQVPQQIAPKLTQSQIQALPEPVPALQPQSISIPTLNPTQSAHIDPIQAPKPVSSTITIEIVNPIGGKGLGREYVANDYRTNPDGTLADGNNGPDNSNAIELGVVLRDMNDPSAGNTLKDRTVTVVATDSSQNKTLASTGNWGSNLIRPDSHTSFAGWYYHFTYRFRTSGIHTITFSAEGISQSVTVNVHPAISTIEVRNRFSYETMEGRHAVMPTEDGSDYVSVCATLKDNNGDIINASTLFVKTSDETQDKNIDMFGASNACYPFRYRFRTSGIHVITFSAGATTKRVNLIAE